MTGNSLHNAALSGITVLDLSECISGQYCARMLADYGADVVLIEPPSGSVLRRQGPLDRHGGSLQFFHLNQNKKSITLDPAAASASRVLHLLAEKADVMIVPPGFDRSTYRRVNPKLVSLMVSNFGTTGPLAGWTGSEMIIQALSGMMKHNGEHDRKPLYGCGDRASYAAGVAGYIAVLAALEARSRLGKGQDIDLDVLETASAMSYPFQLQYIYNGSLEPRGDQRQPLGQFKCKNGWIIFWIYDDRWNAACDALGVAPLAEDPRFKHPKDRIDNWDTFVELVQAAAVDTDAEDLVNRLQAVEFMAARAYLPSELVKSCDHLTARNYWRSVETRNGPRTVPGPQFRFSVSRRMTPVAPPEPGENSLAVYSDLGISVDDVKALQKASDI